MNQTATATSSINDALIAATAASVPYPAITKQVARTIYFSNPPDHNHDNDKEKTQTNNKDDGVFTQIVYTAFSDKILMTISQTGRLGHWVSLDKHVPEARYMSKLPLLSDLFSLQHSKSTSVPYCIDLYLIHPIFSPRFVHHSVLLHIKHGEISPKRSRTN